MKDPLTLAIVQLDKTFVQGSKLSITGIRSIKVCNLLYSIHKISLYANK